MYEQIVEIRNRISRKNNQLGDIFEQIAKEIIERENIYPSDYNSEEPLIGRRTKDITKDFGKTINEIGRGGYINTYPNGEPGNCRPILVCNAIGKWNSFKFGFKGSAKYLVDHYFQSCSAINEGILIFSAAWDEIDFNELYRDKFNLYVQQGKTICVVMVTLQGFSLQYLR